MKTSLDEKTPQSEKNRTLKILFSWLAFPLAIGLLYISLKGLNWLLFWQALKNLNVAILPIFFLSTTVSYGLRALRWKILLSFDKKVSFQNVFWANMAGYFGNNLLPARAGELIRALSMGKLEGIDPSYALATGLVERLMDVLALVAIGAAALSMTRVLSPIFNSALGWMSSLSIFIIALLVLFVFFSTYIRSAIDRIHLISDSTKQYFKVFLDSFIQGIRSLLSWKNLSGFGMLTIAIWLLDGIQTAALSILFNSPISLAQSLVLLAGLGLSSAIPSTPGYVGIYQFVATAILVPFGFSRETAIAFMLVLQIVGLVTIIFWGSLGFLKTSRKKT